MTDDLPHTLTGGEPARLFPVLAETSKEGRALSVLLACVASVDDLSRTLLSTLGHRTGVRVRVRTFTEVVPANIPAGLNGRPDGLITVQAGRRSWSAFVEAKVRRSRLEIEQIETYLKLAKANGIDAVITISNEFAAVPHHHPLRVSRLPKGVGLFHWSWTSIHTHAKVLLAAKSVDDPEQRFLLAELVRFLDHPSTGVMRFDRMDNNWKDLVMSVVAGAPLSKASETVTDTVANWHQECRDLALKLMERVSSNVVTRLPRAHQLDPQRRIADDAESLCKTSKLSVEFSVPDAVSPIKVEADIRTRSIHASMTLRAPVDRKSARARTNWLLRQLSGSDASHLHLVAVWPGRAAKTQETLDEVRSNPDALRPSNPRLAPSAFEVRLVRDIGARFSGAKTFIDDLETTVVHFYGEVGQRLKNWQPAAPKLVEEPDASRQRPTAVDHQIRTARDDAADALIGDSTEHH